MTNERDINDPKSWRLASEDWLNAYKELTIDKLLCEELSKLCNIVADKLESNNKFNVNVYVSKRTQIIYKKYLKSKSTKK